MNTNDLCPICAAPQPGVPFCPTHSEGKMVKVEEIAKGEFVRRKVGASKTYQRGDFDRSTRRYSLVDCDDVSREVWVKKGTLLHIGFSY